MLRTDRYSAFSAIALAALLGFPTTTAASDPGRLVTYPLVYRAPPGFFQHSSPPIRYVVIFHTRDSFAGRDSVGTTIPGSVEVEDSFDNHDGFVGLFNSRPHCYAWNLVETPRLKRKRVGDKVHVRFKLHRTSTQRRPVTLRLIPKHLPNDPPLRPWYHNGPVGQQVRWLGCNPPYGSGRLEEPDGGVAVRDAQLAQHRGHVAADRRG